MLFFGLFSMGYVILVAVGRQKLILTQQLMISSQKHFEN